MDVRFKKVVVGFAGLGVISASVLFWPNNSHKAAHRETTMAKPSTYQSKVMPVEKNKKVSKVESPAVADLQDKVFAPVIKNHQEAKIKRADVKVQQNILNIKLKKEASIIFYKTADKAKFKAIQDSKITALKLKRSTALHIIQAL